MNPHCFSRITLITCSYLGDMIGKLLAFSSMLPPALLVSFVTLILFRRDLHTVITTKLFSWFNYLMPLFL